MPFFLIGVVTIVLCKCKYKCKLVPLVTVLNGANPEEEALVELTADCIDDCCVSTGPLSDLRYMFRQANEWRQAAEPA